MILKKQLGLPSKWIEKMKVFLNYEIVWYVQKDTISLKHFKRGDIEETTNFIFKVNRKNENVFKIWNRLIC